LEATGDGLQPALDLVAGDGAVVEAPVVQCTAGRLVDGSLLPGIGHVKDTTFAPATGPWTWRTSWPTAMRSARRSRAAASEPARNATVGPEPETIPASAP